MWTKNTFVDKSQKMNMIILRYVCLHTWKLDNGTDFILRKLTLSHPSDL